MEKKRTFAESDHADISQSELALAVLEICSHAEE